MYIDQSNFCDYNNY